LQLQLNYYQYLVQFQVEETDLNLLIGHLRFFQGLQNTITIKKALLLANANRFVFTYIV